RLRSVLLEFYPAALQAFPNLKHRAAVAVLSAAPTPWAFVTLTKSAGARAHYDKRRAAGDHHNAALRNLANKLLGRMWWCLQHNEPWDDHAAWPDHQIPSQPAAA
ncbi:hypothetical protein ACFWAM_48525, partial [Rhodococcus jostii]